MYKRNYYDALVKQLENADFSDVTEELNYSNDIEQVISELLNKKEGFEIVDAYESKYEDDVLDLEDEIKKIELEYNNQIDELLDKEAQFEKNRIQHVRTYNEHNRRLSGYGVISDEDNFGLELRNVEKELEEIEKLEKLLNGELSDRKKRKKEELLKRKDDLLNQKENSKRIKQNIYQMYLTDLDNIKNTQRQRNYLIKQLANKKVELYKKRGILRKKMKKYQYIEFKMFMQLIHEKIVLDDKYTEVDKRFNDAIKSDDKNYIAVLGTEYIEVKNKKIEMDKRVEEVAKLFGTTLDELGLVDSKKEELSENLKEKTQTEEVTTKTIEENNTVDEKQDINENDINKSTEPEENPVDKNDDEKPENINKEEKQDINPIAWYEMYKEEILKDQELTDEEVVELINYVDKLKQEFMYLFASFARISDSKYKIKEAIENTKKLVEQKRQEMIENREEKQEENNKTR